MEDTKSHLLKSNNMKHCILVKFNKDFDWKNELDNIKRIFDSIDVEGYHFTEYCINCVNRANRFDLLIRIDIDKEALPLYDVCPSHLEWIENYAKHVEQKAIFDYE